MKPYKIKAPGMSAFQEYPGPTTIMGIKEKQWMAGYATKCFIQKAKARIDEISYVDLCATTVFEILDECRYQHKTESAEACEVGTAVHRLIKDKITGQNIRETDCRHRQVENGFNAFLNWNKGKKIKWLATEFPIFYQGSDFGIAGTCDAIAEIDGVNFLIDFKTSKDFFPDMAWQVAAYIQAWNQWKGKSFNIIRPDYAGGGEEETVEIPDIGIKHGAILRLDKEGKPAEFHDVTPRLETAWRAFSNLAVFYYTEKKRRLKNNPYVSKYFPKKGEEK